MKSLRRRLAAVTIIVTSTSAGLSLAQTTSPTVVVGDLQLAPAGSTQMAAVDVSFELDSSTGIPIAGFQLELSLVGPDDMVTFSGVTAPQFHSYLFAGNSDAPLFSVSPDGQQLTIGDFLDAGFGEIVNGGGLAAIQLSVQPGAAAKVYELLINTDPSSSFLAVDLATFIPFDTRNGTILVVPEPTTRMLVLAVVLAGVLRRTATNRYRSSASVIPCLVLQRAGAVAARESAGPRS